MAEAHIGIIGGGGLTNGCSQRCGRSGSYHTFGAPSDALIWELWRERGGISSVTVAITLLPRSCRSGLYYAMKQLC